MADDERLEDSESEESTEELEDSDLEETGEDTEPADEEGAEGGEAGPSPKPASVDEQLRRFQTQLDSVTQRYDTEIKRLQNESAYYRNRYEEATRGPAKEEAEEEPPVSEEDWYKSPVKASAAIAKWTLEQEKKKLQKETQTRNQQTMRRAYMTGRDQAFRSYPKLIKGIENEVEQYVVENIKNGRIQDPTDISNPEIWAIAAESIRRSKGELDFSKYYSQAPPMASEAPYSEVPAGRRTGERRRPVLDQEARIFIEEINRGEKKKITEDELFDAMGKGARKPNPFKKGGMR